MTAPRFVPFTVACTVTVFLALALASCSSTDATPTGTSTTTEADSSTTSDLEVPIGSLELEDLRLFISQNWETKNEDFAGVFLYQSGVVRSHTSLLLDLTEWPMPDGGTVYLLDLFRGCDRVPGLLEAADEGGLIWRAGYPPVGLGFDDVGSDCDIAELGPQPELFNHLPRSGSRTPVSFAFTGNTVVLSVGDYSETFEAQGR